GVRRVYWVPDFLRRAAIRSITGKSEMGRQNTHNCFRVLVERNRLSDRIAIGAELRIPEFIGHDHRVAFTFTESATEEKWNAEHREEIRGHPSSVDHSSSIFTAVPLVSCGCKDGGFF